MIRVVSDFVTTGERPRIIYCQMDAMHLINFVIYSFINVLVSLVTGTLILLEAKFSLAIQIKDVYGS